MSYKLYRRHNCTRRHRTWRTAADCIWPRAEWVTGDGPYALLAYCHVLTVTLWDDPDDAEHQKRIIDATACGHACSRNHEIIQLTDQARGHT